LDRPEGFRPPPELEAIVLRYLDAYGRNDAETMLNLYSESPSLGYVGSAKDEIWDSETVRVAHPRYIQDKPT